MSESFGARVRRWWEGTYFPYENDPYSSVVIIGGYYEIHWTARVCRAVLLYARQNHQWLIGTALGLIGLLIAYLKLK